jgi:tRNA(adenine34) deaminase
MGERMETLNTSYMEQALVLARSAAAHGDIPVGCVVVKNDEIIGQGQNRRELYGDATAHAEVEAIRQACQTLGSWRLNGCTLYVTVEPCPMCAGAIGWAQVPRIVYGAADEKRGYQRFAPNVLHPRANAVGGILEEECRQLMLDFFKSRR